MTTPKRVLNGKDHSGNPERLEQGDKTKRFAGERYP